jgi:hypothetical protein
MFCEHCARAALNDKLISEINIYWGDLVTYGAHTDTRWSLKHEEVLRKLHHTTTCADQHTNAFFLLFVFFFNITATCMSDYTRVRTGVFSYSLGSDRVENTAHFCNQLLLLKYIYLRSRYSVTAFVHLLIPQSLSSNESICHIIVKC